MYNVLNPRNKFIELVKRIRGNMPCLCDLDFSGRSLDYELLEPPCGVLEESSNLFLYDIIRLFEWE